MVGETARRKRAPFLALLLMMLMLLLHTTNCAATASIMKENATSPYHTRMDEPELMFDSEITRMLASDKGHITPHAVNSKEAVLKCVEYKQCLPGKKKAKPGEHCDSYDNRACRK